MARQRSRLQTWRQTLHHYYKSNARDAHRFRYALLAFDLFTVLFIVVTSFLPRGPVIEWLDIAFGLIILADFIARLAISRKAAARVPLSRHLGGHRRDRVVPGADRRRGRRLPAHPANGAAAAHLSAAGAAAPGQPVVPPATRRSSSRWCISSVFIFVMTGIVYETQYATNTGHQELCRRAVFHRDRADHHRVRRHHAAGHARAG